MSAYVRVLEANGCGPPPAPWPGEEVLNPRLLGQGNAKLWGLLCTSVVDLARAGLISALEVYICLTGEELLTVADRAALARLLETARDHSWGARLFLVASRQLDHRRAPWLARESRELWLRAALGGKVQDVLEVEYDPLAPCTIPGEVLRHAADAALDRQRLLRELHRQPGTWRCVVDPQKKLLESLLSTWVQYDGPSPGTNLVVVVDDVLRQMATVRKARKRFPDARCVVVTLHPPSPELEHYCFSEHLGRPIMLLGELELWYFLLRLNEDLPSQRSQADRAPSAEEAWVADTEERLKAVCPPEARVFRAADPSAEPTLVVTSAFNPDEPRQCLEAAKDVGRVVARYPLGARISVEPAITLGRLFGVLDRVKTFQVWIHLGHGAGVHGLEDAEGNLATPELWLQCFLERDCDLAVTIFLTCFSAPVALLFAQAGVSVAVGFEKEVESHMCRELAIDMLDAVVAYGTTLPDTLRGFRRGYRRITAQERIRSGPIAYHATLP